MSGSARNVMGILTNNFLWMRTLGSTPMLEVENRDRFPDRVVSAADKIRELDLVKQGGTGGAAGGAGAGGGWGGGMADPFGDSFGQSLGLGMRGAGGGGGAGGRRALAAQARGMGGPPPAMSTSSGGGSGGGGGGAVSAPVGSSSSEGGVPRHWLEAMHLDQAQLALPVALLLLLRRRRPQMTKESLARPARPSWNLQPRSFMEILAR